MPTPASSRPEELERARAALEHDGIDFAILSSPANVTYAAGIEAPLALGPIWEIASWLPPMQALVTVDASGAVLCADAYAGQAGQSWLGHVHTFESLGQFEPTDPLGTYRRALLDALDRFGLRGRAAVVGIEPSLPSLARDVLAEEFPRLEVRDASPALAAARRTKTERELGILRQAAEAASAAQRRLRELASEPGPWGSDVDVWAELRRAVEDQIGRQVTITGELVTGARTATVAPGGPVGREIVQGDTGLLDVSPRVNGYWADCTNTVVFGKEPDAEQRRYFDAARESCEAAIATLRPGARCSDAAEAVRATMERHDFGVAHYTGHQIGTSVNEMPRLTVYDHSLVEPGMVFCVEPGAYAGEGGPTGARAEKTIIVTDDGPEVINDFAWGL